MYMIKDTINGSWFDAAKSQYNFRMKSILDVSYIHFKTKNKGDLYLTKYGMPFIENLEPDNFLSDQAWFTRNSARLSGTSFTYKVRTKQINGRSLDIVIKWNRMGQDIPGAGDSKELLNAEFNSPFEEFSLVMELRDSKYESGNIITQQPLAIYVPPEKRELWQTGRREYKMKMKIDTHQEIKLDMLRPYLVIYKWIKGLDASEACQKGIISDEKKWELVVAVEQDMKSKGFIVRDRKPHHIIIRRKGDGALYTDRENKILYALVDFELLERTYERENVIQKVKRINYLKRQRDRFEAKELSDFPPHLTPVNILEVDYIYGRAESTKGIIWVVGKDPYLFDYFLPERWEGTQRTRLSYHSEIFYTITKDNIHLVWKVSRVGTLPDLDPYRDEERKILDHGYNSPFEEIEIAIYIGQKGIRTIFPRAIYMTGNKIDISDLLLDERRYKQYRNLLTPDHKPVLRKEHNYLIIWGYWNGPDEKLAVLDGDYYKGINALAAYRNGLITLDEYIELIERKKKRLAAAGIEDLNLKGTHLLLSLDSGGSLVRDKQGLPDVRICNFEFLKKIK
jgi:hypothetical protein